MDADSSRPGGQRLARLALSAAVLLVLTVALMGPAYRIGLLSLGAIFGGVFRFGTLAAISLGAACIIGFLVTSLRTRWSTAGTYAVAFILSAGLVLTMLNLRADARAVPPIHDVTTDLNDPPEFRALDPRAGEAQMNVPARDPAMESLTPEERWRQYHETAYGDLTAVTLEVPSREATDLAERAAREMGWEIVATDPARGRVEATATTMWFGFKDDIVVRIGRSGDDRSTVDVRSVSRVGVSDLGVNAARIRKYLRTLSNVSGNPTG